MNPEIKKYQARASELEKLLSSPEVLSDTLKLQKLNREYAQVREILDLAEKLQNTEKNLNETEETLKATDDPELKTMAEDEIQTLYALRSTLYAELDELINPADPLDSRDVIMEIRAGTGGDEAALFASELFRMYARFAEKKGWAVRVASSSKTDIDGFKEIIFSISGKGVYKFLKYESGVHRVQRIPETEKQGRVHTSTVTVAVLPKAEEVDITLDPKDLRIDTMTAGGHGGQSVNTTYSAVRITHIPTGTMVVCQDERSQQQNRLRALQILRSRLFAQEQERLSKERGDARRSQIGSGQRAEKIRTYNFPQDRITDHRLQENFHNLPKIMDGELDEIIDGLQKKNRV